MRWGVVSVYVLVLLVLSMGVLAGVGHRAVPPMPAAPAAAAAVVPVVQRPTPGPATCGKPSAVVISRAPRVAARTVALTFDDGPGRNTRAVLDVLRREHVHATFFMIGDQLARYADTARLVLSEGHTVGNHSETHPAVAPDPGWSASRLTRELTSSQHHFAEQLGARPCFFRPPGGVLRGAPRITRQHGMSVVLWSVDPRDWADHRASSIEHKAEAGLAQQHPVVLLHDGGSGGQATVDALPGVIASYRAHGYTFVTIDGRT